MIEVILCDSWKLLVLLVRFPWLRVNDEEAIIRQLIISFEEESFHSYVPKIQVDILDSRKTDYSIKFLNGACWFKIVFSSKTDFSIKIILNIFLLCEIYLLISESLYKLSLIVVQRCNFSLDSELYRLRKLLNTLQQFTKFGFSFSLLLKFLRFILCNHFLVSRALFIDLIK